MQYGKIISTGFSQAWKHKTLWIFGLFLSGGMSFNFFDITKKSDTGGWRGFNLPQVSDFLANNLFIIVFVGLAIILGIIIFVVLSMISTGGLIDAAGQLKRNEPYSFGKAIRAGLTYFWRILGLAALTLLVAAAFVIFLVMFGAIAFVIHTVLGILSLLILIPILFVGIFIAAFTSSMADRYIVLQNSRVFDSITDGFNLWKSHLGPSVAYALIYIAVGFGVFLGVALVAVSAILPFVGVAFVNLLVALIVGVPVVMAILLVVEGFSGSAMHLMTTEFYFQLLEEGRQSPAPAFETPGDAPPAPPASDPLPGAG